MNFIASYPFWPSTGVSLASTTLSTSTLPSTSSSPLPAYPTQTHQQNRRININSPFEAKPPRLVERFLDLDQRARLGLERIGCRGVDEVLSSRHSHQLESPVPTILAFFSLEIPKITASYIGLPKEGGEFSPSIPSSRKLFFSFKKKGFKYSLSLFLILFINKNYHSFIQ